MVSYHITDYCTTSRYIHRFHISFLYRIAILFRKVRKSPAMYKRIHGNFLDLLFRRQLDRAPANSHASRVQATPPPCPLCSQKVQNCLPNAYYTWRGSFYGMGISQKMQYLSIFPPLLISIETGKSRVFFNLGKYPLQFSLAKM